MTSRLHYFIAAGLMGINVSVTISPVQADIIPVELGHGESSRLLPNQIVNEQAVTFISGGAARGENLFHVFNDFNVLEGEQVFFLNGNDFSRIFSLTTGNRASRINGTLGILGNGDLFFINSNGIDFGANAVLSLQGDFLGTTADYVTFEDGMSLSSRTTAATPLLSSSVPIGLGFSGQEADITVNNTGHELAGSGILPYSEQTPKLGLSVLPGNRLTLAGSNIHLDGGILRAPDGAIEIIAVEEGFIQRSSGSPNLSYTPENHSTLGDISASQTALIESSGLRGGRIQLTGQNISFTERAVALITGTVADSNGLISVSANNLYINGDTVTQFVVPSNPAVPVEVLPASIISQSLGNNRGIDIDLDVDHLMIEKGGGITARGFQSASPGNISINADSVSLLGHQPQVEILFSTINTLSLGGTEDSGDITINANNINLQEGALIASSSSGRGQAGEIDIEANYITVNGATETSQVPSNIQSSSFSFSAFETEASGNTGNIDISTRQLQVSNGGEINAIGQGSGNTGSVSINASEQLRVFSTIPNRPLSEIRVKTLTSG